MNAFIAFIVIALAVEYATGLVANLLNLRALRPEFPAGLNEVYEPDEYRRSQEYTQATTRFGIVSDTFNLGLLLTFWFAGGFSYLDEVVRDWGLHSIPTGLAYIGVLVIAQTLVSLPFSIYSTFVVEERFGFNKTTPRTFALDLVKGLVLTVVLGGPLLAGVLAFFEFAGSLAWLYCWAAVTIFLLILQFVAPTWIMPLFNKFTPMQTGELRDAILGYARTVDFTIDNIFVIDGSKRSSKANAFFTGFGRNKRIALYDTLVEKHTVPELVAVLAHEIGHYKKRHIQQRMAISILNMGVVFYLLSIFLESTSLFDAFFMDETSVYAGLLFFSLVYTPINMLLTMAGNFVSRRHEYECDLWAAETVEEPGALADALKKLAAGSLTNLTPHPLFVFLNKDHPPMLKRVQAVERV